jgi:ABC-type lipoprotein release transport system permease subunit
MGVLFKLAWRNVLRNKRRTILSGIAVGIGLASLIFIGALMDGMFESMVRTATDTFLGQGQIHAEGFKESLDVEKTIHGSADVMASLSKEQDITVYTPRIIAQGMLSAAAGVQPVLLYGIEPSTEREISIMDDSMVKGEYLSGPDDKYVLVGSKTAEVLEVDVGDRIVLTMAQARTGELSQELFRVGGIYHMGVREADSGLAFIGIHRAQEMLGLPGGVHEIALKFKNLEMAGDRSLPFWKRYSTNGNEAIGWRDIVPSLDGVIELSRVSQGITLALVFGIVALIVMNTLFMSLYERMFEFGVIRAIGTRPSRMAAIIMLEAASLSIISIIIGSIMGYALTAYFAAYGIDYRGIEYAGVTIRQFIYPVLHIRYFTAYPLWIFAFSLLAAGYPAVFAARLKPAEAMRRSM